MKAQIGNISAAHNIPMGAAPAANSNKNKDNKMKFCPGAGSMNAINIKRLRECAARNSPIDIYNEFFFRRTE